MLWFFDPNVIANSSIATIDIGATTFELLALFFLWRFLRQPTWKSSVLAGAVLGIAESCKFSMLILYPSSIVLVLFRRYSSRNSAPTSGRVNPPTWPQLWTILAMSLMVINVIYAFDRVGKPLGSFIFKSRLLSGRVTEERDDSSPVNRFRKTVLESFPVPLPAEYVLGFDSQKSDEEWGFPRLSGGHLVHRGKWYSPFSTLLCKLPIGTVALTLTAILFWLWKSRRLVFDLTVILLPVFFLLLLLSSQTGLNWVIRYNLPIFPLLILSLGQFLYAMKTSRKGRLFVMFCLFCNFISAISVFPYYLSYENELAGGWRKNHLRFLGSNHDWGQDIYRLKQWSVNNPDMTPLVLTTYAVMEPSYLGIPNRPIPASFLQTNDPTMESAIPIGPEGDFYWAISSTLLSGIAAKIELDNGFVGYGIFSRGTLDPRNAIALIGSTIYVFKVKAIPGDDRTAISFRSLLGVLVEPTIADAKFYSSP